MPPRHLASLTHPLAITVDLVVCAVDGSRLAVLLTPARRRGLWALPQQAVRAGADPGAVAADLAASALGRRSSWMAQVGAFGGNRRGADAAVLTIRYVAVTDRRSAAPDTIWRTIGDLPAMATGQGASLTAALGALRDRMDREPVAFRLLPPTFTLTALQNVYELLLGSRLHKASFRRMLQAAYLVQPTDAWQHEGRGRPAQLFRYAPHRRRQSRQGVRFDLLQR